MRLVPQGESYSRPMEVMSDVDVSAARLMIHSFFRSEQKSASGVTFSFYLTIFC
jgi:hypothetical protein